MSAGVVNNTERAVNPEWDTVLARVLATPAGHGLAGMPARIQCGVLAAPAAISVWIEQRAPQWLRDRAQLDLLVIGAEKLDAVDHGRWYQMLPSLLRYQIDVRVTLVGDRLEQGFLSPAEPVAPPCAARAFSGSLARFIDETDPAAYDLAFLFHPGFQKHRGWLADGSLARLVASGVTVVVSSYEQDESQVDRLVARCHGFETGSETLLNPLYLDLSDDGSIARWGRALWQLVGPPPSGFCVDAERLAALDELGHMVMHSIELSHAPKAPYGAQVELRASTGAARPLIYVFDDFFLDPRSAELIGLRAGELVVATQVSKRSLTNYPAAGSELERAIWAAGIKSRYLLGQYPRALDPARRQALGRSMHANLEHRVDAMFRPI